MKRLLPFGLVIAIAVSACGGTPTATTSAPTTTTTAAPVSCDAARLIAEAFYSYEVLAILLFPQATDLAAAGDLAAAADTFEGALATVAGVAPSLEGLIAGSSDEQTKQHAVQLLALFGVIQSEMTVGIGALRADDLATFDQHNDTALSTAVAYLDSGAPEALGAWLRGGCPEVADQLVTALDNLDSGEVRNAQAIADVVALYVSDVELDVTTVELVAELACTRMSDGATLGDTVAGISEANALDPEITALVVIAAIPLACPSNADRLEELELVEP